jgi:hypothetical protein
MNNNEKNLYEKEDNKYNNEKDILYTKKWKANPRNSS